jgi:hypothetical protein
MPAAQMTEAAPMNVIGQIPSPREIDGSVPAVIGEEAGIEVGNKIKRGHIACIDVKGLKRKQKNFSVPLT